MPVAGEPLPVATGDAGEFRAALASAIGDVRDARTANAASPISDVPDTGAANAASAPAGMFLTPATDATSATSDADSAGDSAGDAGDLTDAAGVEAHDTNGGAIRADADRFVAQPLEATGTPIPPLSLVVVSSATTAPPDAASRAASSMPRLVVSDGRSAGGDAIDARLADVAAAMLHEPLAVRREMEALNPELRARLERVIDRMEQEYGYTVDVVETVRTQERQDALYAQGRTQPGPVVTWTRESRHLAGAAADVVIDGGYGNAAGFERLARVAREEGLRTLWPRDPGHVELAPAASRPSVVAAASSDLVAAGRADVVAVARGAGTSDMVVGTRGAPNDAVQALPIPRRSPSALSASAAEGGGRGMARVASVASVASAASVASVAKVAVIAPVATVAPGARVAQVAVVSQVAHVAPVAHVARVDDVARGDDVVPVTDAAATGATIPAGSTTAAASAGANASDRRSENSERRSPGGRGDRQETVAQGVTSRDDREAQRMAFVRESVTPTQGESPSGAVAGLTRTDATERIARVLRLQESGHDRPLSSVLLRLDHPDGGEDRIRIDMRGRTIGATLDVADPRAAERLREHTGELQQALQRQGLEGESLVVRTTSRTTDVAALNASAAAADRDVARAASATASDGGGSTARDSRNQPRASYERDGTDQQRSRQRRDGKGDTR